MEEATENLVCPRCGEETLDPVMERNAVSRYKDEYICSDCGLSEALGSAVAWYM